MMHQITRREALSVLTGVGALIGLEACSGGSGSIAAPTSTPTPAPAGSPPSLTSTPALTGRAYVGRELAVTTGSWTNSPTAYAYQWKRTDPITGATTAIAGATAARFTPTAAEKYCTVACDVTATNATGSATAASNATIGLLPALPTGATMTSQGDSMLAGYNANVSGTDVDPAAAWAKVFADAMGVTFTNQAVSGQTLASVRAAVAGGAAVGANKRDFVLISAGGNDVLNTAASTATFGANYRSLLNRLIAAGYGRDAILIGGFYAIPESVLIARGSTRARWEAFRAVEMQVAQEYGVTWFDFYQLAPVAGDIGADNFHASRQGHQRLAESVIANQPYIPVVPKVPNPRAQVTNLTASAGGAGAISANCDVYPGATGYVFALIDTAGFAVSNSATVSTPARDFAGLRAGSYNVVAKAQLAGGAETPWRFTGAAIAVT